MSARLRVLVVLLVFAACLAMPVSANALVVPLSIEQMTGLADTIVEVRVSAADSRWTHDPVTRERRSIVTDVRTRVTRVLKGSAPADFILTQPGGVVGAMGLHVSDIPDFVPGERCILFLDEYGVVGGYQGKLIVDGAAIVPLSADSVVVSPLAPVISSVVPGVVNAGVGDRITITGSGFGAGPGSVSFLAGDKADGTRVAATVIVSWSDTSIVCEVPRLAESGTVLVTTSGGVASASPVSLLVGFSDSGMTWGTSSVTYRINENTADLVGEGAAIRRALGTWSSCGADFTLNDGGPCASTVYPITAADVDGYNDIYFSPTGFSTGYLAMNSYWYYTSAPNVKIESDIVFNDAYAWADGAVSGRIDVESVALHELGHTVGLDDQYGDGANGETMASGAYNFVRRSLSSYDIAGAIHMWGAVADTTPPGAPTVGSSTHPSQTVWYGNANPSFTFSATDPSGVGGYSYAFDAVATTVPDTVSEGTATSKTYTGIADGEWYFHVRAVDTVGNWGATTHYRVRIETVVDVGVSVYEVQGSSRFDTAVRASVLAYPSGASTVVIATGRNWPDALGGAALAGAVDGPILLAEATGLPDSVKAEIARLRATSAVILGGTNALGAGVERDLAALGVSFTRLGGGNRYATADLIASATVARLGSYDGTAFVATGLNFPDALAASPMAAANGWPVVLTSRTEAPSSLVARLKALGVTSVVVLGGPIAVPDGHYAVLAANFAGVTRLSGNDRYATCERVADFAVTRGGMSFSAISVSVGTNFPDALSGGPLCGKTGGVMLLSGSTSLPAVIQSPIVAHKAEVASVYFLGGTGALTPAVRTQVTSLLD